jgi:hypothetical protein
MSGMQHQTYSLSGTYSSLRSSFVSSAAHGCVKVAAAVAVPLCQDASPSVTALMRATPTRCADSVLHDTRDMYIVSKLCVTVVMPYNSHDAAVYMVTTVAALHTQGH